MIDAQVSRLAADWAREYEDLKLRHKRVIQAQRELEACSVRLEKARGELINAVNTNPSLSGHGRPTVIRAFDKHFIIVDSDSVRVAEAVDHP